ncbi:DUF6530 family protein [Sphingobacterium sp. lm-10]|uniref:DUF6530 family protein n=1 Tax=Sphingobacterium sp. lm-10 TaxID=2944904 RepID=UPI00202156C5|nr:DUF6530 family protein [Sphingobacterium sp. lm-10]MCL7987089.1 DUF6530 family protein [Sphingobacterium sp. lm-10]
MTKIPTHLKHKPIIAVDNYDKIDSKYAGQTDAKYLSIGEAQYNVKEISLKVFRNVNNKWSRQSEELPIHRNIDLNILFLASLLTDINANYSQSSLREEIIESSKIHLIKNYYDNHKEKLYPRLEELKSLLDKFLAK